MIGMVRSQARHLHRIGTQSSATVGMVFINGRIIALTPAETAFSDCTCPLVHHFTTTCRRITSDVANRSRVHHRQAIRRGERNHFAEGSAFNVRSVRTRVINRMRRKARHFHLIATHSRARRSMVIRKRRRWGFAPANASIGDFGTTVVAHIGKTTCRNGRNVSDFHRIDCRFHDGCSCGIT